MENRRKDDFPWAVLGEIVEVPQSNPVLQDTTVLCVEFIPPRSSGFTVENFLPFTVVSRELASPADSEFHFVAPFKRV